MKRNEMVKLIEKTIADTILGYYEDLYYDDAAKAVLDMIELKGMLPPYYEKPEEKELRIKTTTPELAEFYKWEDED